MMNKRFILQKLWNFDEWLQNLPPLEPFVTEDLGLTRAGKMFGVLFGITLMLSIIALVATSIMAIVFVSDIMCYDTIDFAEIQMDLRDDMPLLSGIVWLGLSALFLIFYLLLYTFLVIVLHIFDVSAPRRLICHIGALVFVVLWFAPYWGPM